MSRYVRAYHLIITTYGFWLPTDPRGSWSDFVRAWELFRFGPDGATALMVLKTDQDAPDALINRLRARPGIVRVKKVALPPRNGK